MWRTFLALGGMTGCIVGLAIHVPLPPLHGERPANLVRPPADGTYRMDGVITLNTCPFEPAALSREWTLRDDMLSIGDRRLRGRAMQSGMLYQARRSSDDGCLEAAWDVKLTPKGRGVRGTVVWEVWKASPKKCNNTIRRPCMMKFEVQGLPATFRPVGG